jgi:hypothetical protein
METKMTNATMQFSRRDALKAGAALGWPGSAG